MCFSRGGTIGVWLCASLLLVAAVIIDPRTLSAAEERPFLTDREQFNYGKLLYEQGHYRVAAREFGKVISDFPDSPLKGVAHFRMGAAYKRAGSDREAVVQFRQFLENYPGSKLSVGLRERIVALERSKSGADTPRAVPLPVVQYGEERPLRAVQISVFDGKSYGEVEREFDALKQSGVNTVILRVFHNRGDRYYSFVTPRGDEGVYFRTDHAPVVADVLGRIIEMAHARGMRLFAWMTTRYADYGLEGRFNLDCKGYDIPRDALVACKGLDLFNDETLRHLEGLYSDLAEYDIDGILFQDDLVLRHTEGFGRYAAAYYWRETGRALAPAAMYGSDSDGALVYTPEFWRWAALKNRRILEVARRLMGVVKEKRPGTEFALNLMYEAVSSPRNGLAWLSQDLSAAVREGFDYYAVMAYHRQMRDELGKSESAIKALIEDMRDDAVKIVGDPRKVLMKLQSVDWETSAPLTNRELHDLLARVGRVKGVSLALFPYRTDIALRNY